MSEQSRDRRPAEPRQGMLFREPSTPESKPATSPERRIVTGHLPTLTPELLRRLELIREALGNPNNPERLSSSSILTRASRELLIPTPSPYPDSAPAVEPVGSDPYKRRLAYQHAGERYIVLCAEGEVERAEIVGRDRNSIRKMDAAEMTSLASAVRAATARDSTGPVATMLSDFPGLKAFLGIE